MKPLTDKNELFGFLQTRFRQQQYFLPSALCGNLFGLKKTDDDRHYSVPRQFAFGRSLMKRIFRICALTHRAILRVLM